MQEQQKNLPEIDEIKTVKFLQPHQIQQFFPAQPKLQLSLQNIMKDSEIISFLNYDSWSINDLKYLKKMAIVFQLSKSIDCSDLYIQASKDYHSEYLTKNQKKNCTLKIFKSLERISFSNLTFLLINQQEMINNQFLVYLQAPNLNKFYLLNKCRITRQRSLKKCRFLNLQILNLQYNPLNQFSLARFQTKSKFQSLVLQTQESLQRRDKNSQNYINDLSIMFKFEPRQLQRIRIQSQKRIRQNKINELLKQKFVSKLILFIS